MWEVPGSSGQSLSLRASRRRGLRALMELLAGAQTLGPPQRAPVPGAEVPPCALALEAPGMLLACSVGGKAPDPSGIRNGLGRETHLTRVPAPRCPRAPASKTLGALWKQGVMPRWDQCPGMSSVLNKCRLPLKPTRHWQMSSVADCKLISTTLALLLFLDTKLIWKDTCFF